MCTILEMELTKLHDVFLQHLRRVCELPDVTETEDGVHLQQAGAFCVCQHRGAHASRCP